MTPLLVIRHAPTEWNAAGRIQGRADLALSEAGRRWLKGVQMPADWDGAICLSSPLRRATETARLLGLDPQPEPALIEMDWGGWQGRRLADLRAELGAEMAENEARGLDFRPPGGESPRDVQARLLPRLRMLSAPTVVVTHKGVLRALYALATGWDMKGKSPDKLLDGHAHEFGVAGDAVVVRELNLALESRP